MPILYLGHIGEFGTCFADFHKYREINVLLGGVVVP